MNREQRMGMRLVPPAPNVMAQLYAEYVQRGKPNGLTFKQYLEVIGFVNLAEDRRGMDDGVQLRAVAAAGGGPELIQIPTHPIRGALKVLVLLVDFNDRPGTTSPSHYESMLLSKGSFTTGSMRDYYSEVSSNRVDITGSVHGWLRLPQPYSYYTNSQSGTGNTYPRNAQGMAEAAVEAALVAGVRFGAELDVLGQGTITALFIIHAGVGAEAQTDSASRANNIWSHKWTLRRSLQVADQLGASVYLTVPHDAKIGVCAHELGHLAFQWEDFYDPNYDEDGSEWDGSGRWDLMAGGSWNGSGVRPAHPSALHKVQHGWVELQELRQSGSVVIDPYASGAGKVVKIISREYRSGQYLLLENRARAGFDADLPGEGLLVWRVDESRDMFKPDRPALLLLQADGRHDLERVGDWNEGDAGDPFPGTANRTDLDDEGDLSTTFPGGNASGVRLSSIVRDPGTGRIRFDVAVEGDGPPDDTTLSETISPSIPIPDAPDPGVSSGIVIDRDGVVQDVAVSVQISHSYVGDLRVELVSPSGIVALLHDRAGGSSHDIETVYRVATTGTLRAVLGDTARGEWRLLVRDHARADIGVLIKWGIALSLDLGEGTVFGQRSPHLSIPDADPAGIADTLQFSRAGSAQIITARVNITHTYIQDLRLELVSPTGQAAVLQDRAGGSADNIERIYCSDTTPALAGLIGSDVRGTWALRVADLCSRDRGTLEDWSVEIKLAAPARIAVADATPELAIPDNTPAGVGSALAFAQRGTVQALELGVLIEHSYIGDLRVELLAPSGRSAVLHDRAGGRTRNLELDISSASSVALASLVGQPLAGSWVLRVADLAREDIGTLKSWSLKVNYR